MERLKFLIAKGARHLFALLLVAGLAVAAAAETSTYTVSGSWTAPEGVFSVTAEVWGGGGGGGGGTGGGYGGAGGGGGGYARRILGVTPGEVCIFTVGTGGAGIPSGTGINGNQSWFKDMSTAVANGGGGGGANGTPAGSSGSGIIGDATSSGSSGSPGSPTMGGNGGSGAFPNGGPGGPGSNVSNNGGPGGVPGGGGGGGGPNMGTSGGLGASGQVVVTYTLPRPGTPAASNASQESIAVTWSTTNTLNGYRLEASTASNFTGTLFSSKTAQVLLSTLSVSGLLSNTTYYLRVGTLWQNTTYYAATVSTPTRIEQPSSVYIDEVSSRAITASVYASTFSNFAAGLSGANLAKDGTYSGWMIAGSSWTERNTVPGGNFNQAAAAALNGKVYVIGGTPNGTTSMNQNYEFSPQTGLWSSKQLLPTPRYGPAAAAAAGRIYVVGGFNSSAVRQNANEAYDPASNTWATMAAMPTPRGGFGLAALGGKLYAVGGNDAGALKNKTEIYDPAANAWTTGNNLTVPRQNLAVAALKGKIYALGGSDPGYRNDNEAFDPETGLWSPRAPLPEARHSLGAGVVGGKLYAFSGYNGSYLSRSDVYDPDTNTWASAAPMPVPREGMAAAQLKGKIYLLGGHNGVIWLSSATVYTPGVSASYELLLPNTQYQLKGKARNLAGTETGETPEVGVYTLAIATMPSGSLFPWVSPREITVSWGNGSPIDGYNGPGASYKVEASTKAGFNAEIRFREVFDQTNAVFSGLEHRTTYYFRVQAYNSDGATDNYWTLLGSTRTPAEPLGGVEITPVTQHVPWMNDNWARRSARDSQGNLYTAYNRQYGGTYHIFVARSTDNGETWAETTAAPVDQAAALPLSASFDQRQPALAIDSQDRLHLVWGGRSSSIDAAENKLIYTVSFDGGTAWSAYEYIPANPYNGWEGPFNIAVDSSDGQHVVWSGENAGGAGTYRVRYSSRAAIGQPWTPYVSIGDDGKYASYPALAVDSHDGVHILAQHASGVGTNTSEEIVYSSRTQFTGWGAWTVVRNGGVNQQGPPSLTMTPGGTLYGVWHAPGGGFTNPQIWYSSRAYAAPGWSAAVNITADDQAPQTDPSAAADAIGNVYVLWASSDAVNPYVNMKGSVFNGTAWDTIEELSDETTGYQNFVSLRWSGWRNNGGGIDVFWHNWDGTSSTASLRHMQGPDVPMSPGWSETEWPGVGGCGYAINVRQDGTGDFAGIQQALVAVPSELSTTTCIVIRDDAIYAEQVTLQGFKMGRWDEQTSHRLVIMGDPSFISSGPVISPPLLSTAAFHIMNDSVTVQGITIAPQNTVPYGILASSAAANISGVNIISGGKISVAGLRLSSYSAVEFSSVTVQAGKGIWVSGLGSSISRSSAAATGLAGRALYLSGASSNTFAGIYAHSQAGEGVSLSSSSFNTFTQSTMTANAFSYFALGLNASSSNTIDGNHIYNAAGYGADFTSSNNNSVYRSSITGNAASVSALRFSYSSFNSVSESHIQSPTGYGIYLGYSNYNGLNFSTVTAAVAASEPALYIYNSATNTITSSYVSGSSAAFISSVNGVTIVRDSVLRGIAANGVGLSMIASKGLFMASSTVSGGSQGAGFYFAPGNSSKIELASNTINGGKYGLNISALNVGGSLVISSITFQSLTAGATAINFLGGQFNTEIDRADFKSPNIQVNVNGELLSAGSNVFFAHPEGKWGALYERDHANNYVRWPWSGAVLTGPADGVTDVSPAPALHAMADGGSTAAQYHYQVDTAETMDSQGVTPLYSFDQTAAQAYFNQGAFSGQDWTVSVSSDAFVYNSTATFVFYSTGTQLNANALYYWRVRARSLESGEYGQWTTTASFVTGEMAAAFPSPVNSLSVTGVTLAEPTAAGVNVSFILRENNVSTGTTPNGANYNTADWIFVKFSTQAGADGTWNHATLTGGTVGGGGAITPASDNKGVFLDHTSVFPLWQSPVTVRWNYGADGVAGGDAIVKVFAISMVKVPQGQFVYNGGGIGGSLYNNYGNGSQSNVLSATDRPDGADVGWPSGYNSFYIMRYELTQGQYADFLNTVHSATAAVRFAPEITNGHIMAYNAGSAYGWRYSAKDRFAAKNYLSTTDAWSYLSWAALRPVTEMEFEKACRDTGGDARAYPWGATAPDAVTYEPPNESGTHARNYMNYNSGAVSPKVLDGGRYLSGDVYRTPEQTGASPYGIADLAGNVFEHVINCSYTSIPENGNGTALWPAAWPAPDSDQKGVRGGNMYYGGSLARVSDRTYIGWTDNIRYFDSGARGGRLP